MTDEFFTVNPSGDFALHEGKTVALRCQCRACTNETIFWAPLWVPPFDKPPATPSTMTDAESRTDLVARAISGRWRIVAEDENGAPVRVVIALCPHCASREVTA